MVIECSRDPEPVCTRARAGFAIEKRASDLQGTSKNKRRHLRLSESLQAFAGTCASI